MEDASKALLIGASTLIAVLVIALAVQLFNSASGVSETYDEKMQTSEIRSFNAHFTQYIGAGTSDSDKSQHYATIYDVITTANFAYENNAQYEEPTDYANNTALVRVNVKLDGSYEVDDLQDKSETDKRALENEYYYADNTNPNIQAIRHFKVSNLEQNQAGKIYKITFTILAGSSTEE